MSESPVAFTELMESVKSGSDEAVRELLDRYGHAIFRAIRRRLHRKLRSQFDSQDFYQAVWASFFANREIIARFDREEKLVAFLQTVAGNKVVDECRRRLVLQKYNVNRECSIHANRLTQSNTFRDTQDGASLPDNTATPSEIVVAKEEMARLVAGQPSRLQRIVQLRVDGASIKEIADNMGMNERVVRRVIKRLSNRVNQ